MATKRKYIDSIQFIFLHCLSDALNFTTSSGTTIEVVGRGNHSECQTILDMFLKTAEDSWCYPKPCAIGRTYQPSVGNMLFYAIAGFVYSPTYLGALGDRNRLNISLLRQNAQVLCGKVSNVNLKNKNKQQQQQQKKKKKKKTKQKKKQKKKKTLFPYSLFDAQNKLEMLLHKLHQFQF